MRIENAESKYLYTDADANAPVRSQVSCLGILSGLCCSMPAVSMRGISLA
jgi:hypothetical protein